MVGMFFKLWSWFSYANSTILRSYGQEKVSSCPVGREGKMHGSTLRSWCRRDPRSNVQSLFPNRQNVPRWKLNWKKREKTIFCWMFFSLGHRVDELVSLQCFVWQRDQAEDKTSHGRSSQTRRMFDESRITAATNLLRPKWLHFWYGNCERLSANRSFFFYKKKKKM